MDLAMLMCRGPESSDWELPLRDPAACLLLGWVVKPESFDGGAPWPVRKLLSQVLCRTGVVTYLAHNGTAVANSKHRIVTSSEATVVSALFDDAAYPWTQHGQAVFLSNTPPASVSAKILTEVAGQRKVEAAERAGFQGLMLPGVDGAVAGIWMFGAGAVAELAARIQECCKDANAEFHELGEDEFRFALTGS